MLLVIVGAVWWSTSNKGSEPNNPEVTISEVDTSDWLTYRNERHKFTFKYPQFDKVIQEFGDESNGIEQANDFYVGGLYIAVIDNNTQQTLQKFIEEHVGVGNFDYLDSGSNRKEIRIISDQPTKFTIKNANVLNTTLYKDTEMFFVNGGNSILWLTSRIGLSGDGVLSAEEKLIAETVSFE